MLTLDSSLLQLILINEPLYTSIEYKYDLHDIVGLETRFKVDKVMSLHIDDKGQYLVCKYKLPADVHPLQAFLDQSTGQ